MEEWPGAARARPVCTDRASNALTARRLPCPFIPIPAQGKLDKEDEEALRVEVDILNAVEHPNIVKLRQVFDTPKTFFMVMELMSGGELFERIVQKSRYSEKEASAVARKLAGALAYCHERNIVHRDLKPENLLYSSPDDDADIKIADFGLAKLLDPSTVMATACGTPGYVAPEILDGAGYTSKVDCWSLGVIIYILLCGFPPFYDENNAALFAQIKTASFDFPSPFWDTVSDAAKDLVRKLLVVDVETRLSAAGVLAHPWVRDGGSEGSVLGSAYDNLRKLNARKRFRQGVRKVMAAQTFLRFGKIGAVVRAAKEAAAAAAAAAAAGSGGGGGGGGGSGGGAGGFSGGGGGARTRGGGAIGWADPEPDPAQAAEAWQDAEAGSGWEGLGGRENVI